MNQILSQMPKAWRRLLMNIAVFLLVSYCLIALFSARTITHTSYEHRRPPVDINFATDMRPGLPYVPGRVKLFPSENRSMGLAPSYPASFFHTLHPDLFPYVTDDPEGRMDELLTLDLDSLSESELLERVLEGFTIPTYQCRKMVRIGGSYCTGRAEAEKVVCFDADMRPEIDDCLVYSFGVGHELSFDMAIANYGCDVFAFDSDYRHMSYPRNIYPRVTFLKVRLGWRREVLVLTDPSGRFPYVYRPLHDLKIHLGHAQAQIAFLKIDIENSEWDVFEKSVFKTRVLERTKQLSLEVHLDYLYPESQFDQHPDGQLGGLRSIARVLRGLHQRGFRLAFYEPNYNAPVNRTLHGRNFHIYFETVWLNTKLWPSVTTKAAPDLNSFDTMPSVGIIHNSE
ncbi:uncharacterized protein LOC108668940 [Hyalella azteca]|uniref:Uncharacterized protein LOC108668940 n=1 Tax=Hyalella azteca TaxID=294128 RepID=A0A8B7NDL9_HYAAZ|nr:uncharacterized protein LOC108668940 [Hyalella azteca]